MRVKAKGKWKPVNIAPHVPEGTDLEGFIGMEVLTEYDLFEQTHEVQETAGKKVCIFLYYRSPAPRVL